MRGGIILAGLFGAAVAAGSASAQTPPQPVHDAVAEFSLNANPNGVWSYHGFNHGPGGEQLLRVPEQAFRGMAGWQAWTNGKAAPNTAFVARNVSGAAIHQGRTVVPKGQLLLDPEDALAVSLVFKAPATGLYRASGFFSGVDKAERFHNVQVGGKNRLFFREPIYQYGLKQRFHFYFTVRKGETVEFQCASSGGPPQQNATGLKLLIKGPISK